MALKPPGKNAPIDEDTRRQLFAYGRAVDVATTPPRTEKIGHHKELRSYTLEELVLLLSAHRSSRQYFLELPWDERHASALADRAVSLVTENVPPADPHLAVVLLAGSGRFDEARALYERMGPNERLDAPNGGGAAALAAGDFEVHSSRPINERRMPSMRRIVRFRPIVDRIAASAETLLARLPDFFAGSADIYRPKYLEIWSPVLRAFALLAQSDEKTVDAAYAALLAEVSAVRLTKDDTPYLDQHDALHVLFQLAIHQKRLVSAHRIASKLGTGTADRYRRIVAVEYAKLGDLGGVWEIVQKMRPAPIGHLYFDELAQTLHDRAS